VKRWLRIKRGLVYYIHIGSEERAYVRCVRVRSKRVCRKCGGVIEADELAFCQHIGAPGLYATYWYHITCVEVVA
jgi:hypothetical protein